MVHLETGGPQVADSPLCYPQNRGPTVAQGLCLSALGVVALGKLILQLQLRWALSSFSPSLSTPEPWSEAPALWNVLALSPMTT